MSSYNYYKNNKEEPEKKEIHPIWRGIGCLITVITPIISWAASLVLVDYGEIQKWPFLMEMSGTVRFSDIFYQIPFVDVAANYLSSIHYLIPLVIFFILFLIFFTGVFSVLNAVVFRMFGPSRYGDLDAPAPKVKPKRYTR